MKKMMFFAVMMSVMLMPAQMMARENNKAKPRVENRVKRNEKKAPKMKFDNVRPGKPDKRKISNNNRGQKPMPPVARRAYKPMPKPKLKPRPMPKPKLKPRPMPRPRPVPRPVYHHHCCDNDFVETAATVIGLAALISAIAD